MTTKTQDTPRLYVGTYAKYNNGSIKGAWLDLDDYADEGEFLEACAELHKDESDPEFMFQDFEGFPKSLYSESGLDSKLWDYIEACNESNQEIVNALIENGFELDQEHNVIDKDGANFEAAIGYHFAECIEIPEHISNYFDYEAYGRDISYEGTYIDLGDTILEIIN